MFSGIVEVLGTVAARRAQGDGARLEISCPVPADDPLAVGESIAVNGACLTVVEPTSRGFAVDLSRETLERTTLGRLAAGARVNLERALAVGERLGGHFVTGHVDGVGRLLSRTGGEGAVMMRFAAPPEVRQYLIPKGSVAVDGISLTVIDPGDGAFEVALIPHTLAVTTLGELSEGGKVNLEADLLGKYVKRLLEPEETAGLTEERLRELGFA